MGINTEQIHVYFQVRDLVSKALFNSLLSQILTVKQLLTLINSKYLTSYKSFEAQNGFLSAKPTVQTRSFLIQTSKFFSLHQALYKLHATSHKIQQCILLLECIFLE